MKIAGIAAEYNPFHLGHQYHIEQTRAAGYDGIIAVMSGNFMQRGECALFDKFTRAKAAVEGGVNLVLELPVRYSLSSAEGFAEGCVRILDATGCVDIISFGSESGDLNKLKNTAEKATELTHEELKKAMSDGVSFAKARGELLKEKGVLSPDEPNDILAVEYLKALNKIKSKIKPFTIKRLGKYHGYENGFMGASKIREILKSGKIPENAIPKATLSEYLALVEKGLAPADMSYLERIALYMLRTADAKVLSEIQGATEGIENRLIKSAHEALSIEELYKLTKSKRYTLSGIRRLLCCALAGIKKSEEKPPYIRVLAFDKKGTEILSVMKNTSVLPVLHGFSPETAADPRFKNYILEELRAGDIFALCTPEIYKGYRDFTQKITITGK